MVDLAGIVTDGKSVHYSTLHISTICTYLGNCAGIFEQSMGDGSREGIGLSYRPADTETVLNVL
jgi:hypothetical protein